MREIQLTRGYAALVDDEDFERINAVKWCVEIKRRTVNGLTLYYASRNVMEGIYYKIKKMHREILFLQPDDPQVDHKDSDGLNNQKHNLRLATGSQNQGNQRKQITNKTSQYKGVCWNSSNRLWHARVTENYRMVWQKYFKSELEAALAYDEKAREVFGVFARTNFDATPTVPAIGQ